MDACPNLAGSYSTPPYPAGGMSCGRAGAWLLGGGARTRVTVDPADSVFQRDGRGAETRRERQWEYQVISGVTEMP
jgi:hypothetical protein